MEVFLAHRCWSLAALVAALGCLGCAGTIAAPMHCVCKDMTPAQKEGIYQDLLSSFPNAMTGGLHGMIGCRTRQGDAWIAWVTSPGLTGDSIIGHYSSCLQRRSTCYVARPLDSITTTHIAGVGDSVCISLIGSGSGLSQRDLRLLDVRDLKNTLWDCPDAISWDEGFFGSSGLLEGTRVFHVILLEDLNHDGTDDIIDIASTQLVRTLPGTEHRIALAPDFRCTFYQFHGRRRSFVPVHAISPNSPTLETGRGPRASPELVVPSASVFADAGHFPSQGTRDLCIAGLGGAVLCTQLDHVDSTRQIRTAVHSVCKSGSNEPVWEFRDRYDPSGTSEMVLHVLLLLDVDRDGTQEILDIETVYSADVVDGMLNNTKVRCTLLKYDQDEERFRPWFGSGSGTGAGLPGIEPPTSRRFGRFRVLWPVTK